MTQAEAPKTWTIGSLVKWATDDFRARGIENPRLDAEVLVAHALGIDRTRVIIESLRPLEGAELAELRELVKRRRAREPIAYLRGTREFYGLTFQVDPRVLIPRPDTEALVECALARSAHVSLSMRLLDLCTGSGCVAIAIARQRPTARVVAIDVSAGALEVARTNAYRLGAYNVAFVESDLFAAVPPQRFDVITANPPYVATGEIAGLMADVRDFEPRLALDGGADGLDLVRRILDGAPAYLEAEGVLALEIGAGEAEAAVALFAERGYREVRVDRDYAKIERVVSGIRPA
ncbi:MAG: peptide chain release factor N(5)-glutamine methyltransferase [Labilithrix sp.]|nr:peptide chain release factor N(5)-glutamine methyltransferase [Labilithrix sp.]MCW5809992.1 peptide chain release factor N(5)-glutamine methyltransferase [Labilithrix sp.]